MSQIIQKETFFKLTAQIMQRLRNAGLTAAEYKFFMYLCEMESLGNRYIQLPSQSAIALELGLSRKTVNQAQSKLQRLGLFDFKVAKWECRNLMGAYADEYMEQKTAPCNQNVTPCNQNVTGSEKNVTHLSPQISPEERFSPPKDFKDLKDSLKELEVEKLDEQAQRDESDQELKKERTCLITPTPEEEPAKGRKNKAAPSDNDVDKPKLKALKQQEQTEYDSWYESAYALGWVSRRDGVRVQMKRGLYIGRYFHWQEVEKNKAHFLTDPAQRKPGQFTAALKKA